MPSTKSPPIIDFSDYLSGNQKRMEHCAAQIREACLTQGFFQIVNHDIPLSLQKQMFKVSKEFFDLPLEEKMKLDKSLVSKYSTKREIQTAKVNVELVQPWLRSHARADDRSQHQAGS